MTKKERQLGKCDNGVSEIVGEMMLTAITVMIFALLIVAVNAMITRPQTEIVHFNALAVNDTTFMVQHTGGDSVSYSDIRVMINGNTPAATATDTNANGIWDTGESIYIFNINTRQNLDIIVYDNALQQTLGNFYTG